MRAKKFTAAVVMAAIAAIGFAPLANAAVRPTTAQKLQLPSSTYKAWIRTRDNRSDR
jgi:hypothetical protein